MAWPAKVQGEGELGRGVCRPRAPTLADRRAGPGPGCSIAQGGPRPEAPGLSGKQLRTPLGQAPSGTPPKPTRQVVLVPSESPGLWLGDRPKVTEPANGGGRLAPRAGPRSPGPSRRAGARLPAWCIPGAGAACDTRGGAGRVRRTPGRMRACQRGGTLRLQPCSSSTAGDGAWRRDGPSAQLQLPEGQAARAWPGCADSDGDVSGAAGSPPTPGSAPRGVRALGRARLDGIRGHPSVCPRRRRGRADSHSRRALRAGAR